MASAAQCSRVVGNAQLVASMGVPKLLLLATDLQHWQGSNEGSSQGVTIRSAADRLLIVKPLQAGHQLIQVVPEANQFSTSLTSGWQSAACCPCP